VLSAAVKQHVVDDCSDCVGYGNGPVDVLFTSSSSLADSRTRSTLMLQNLMAYQPVNSSDQDNISHSDISIDT